MNRLNSKQRSDFNFLLYLCQNIEWIEEIVCIIEIRFSSIDRYKF